MTTIAEIKANALYRIAKNIGERILEKRLAPLDFTRQPSNTDAFGLAAYKAHQQLNESLDPTERAQAAIELTQQFINTSRFRSARNLLQRFPDLSGGLSSEQQLHLNASQQEKYGWIADAETGYQEAQDRFWSVKRILHQVPREKWPTGFKNLDSTATHFGARAKLGLASQRINPEYNLQAARNGFIQDLEYFKDLRKQGDPHPFNEGFQYGWLAVGSMQEHQMQRAAQEIDQAEQAFREGLSDNPRSGIPAHTHLLHGLWHLKQSDPIPAKKQFTEAIRIRTEVEKYPLGLAFAQIGISAAYFQERSFVDSFNYLKHAVNTQPAILVYLLNGRMLG